MAFGGSNCCQTPLKSIVIVTSQCDVVIAARLQLESLYKGNYIIFSTF